MAMELLEMAEVEGAMELLNCWGGRSLEPSKGIVTPYHKLWLLFCI